jgi:hypothetical protein
MQPTNYWDKAIAKYSPEDVTKYATILLIGIPSYKTWRIESSINNNKKDNIEIKLITTPYHRLTKKLISTLNVDLTIILAKTSLSLEKTMHTLKPFIPPQKIILLKNEIDTTNMEYIHADIIQTENTYQLPIYLKKFNDTLPDGSKIFNL